MESTNDKIRNFCIIAHIDHGKSTLADRFLELTGTVSKRELKTQMLDSMELERERGITIKLAPARLIYQLSTASYQLNLIDTPGHVDFNYEVSRSLAAVEGAVLLVDASQGVQAQTIGNLYLAIEQDLKIIPVINKIDLPNADVEKTKAEIIHLTGCQEDEIILASGKTGQGVEEVLTAIVNRVPPPAANKNSKTRALIFDSTYNEYKGVVASVRVVDGELTKGDRIYLIGTKTAVEVLELGHFAPKFKEDKKLENGQIGYIITGLKDVRECQVGDTITHLTDKGLTALPGYKEVKPMVYAGIFPKEGDNYEALREAVDKLKLNDGALIFEPEHSPALGFGFRCGFLGMLHLDVFKERLSREYNLDIIITVPSVAYQVSKTNGEEFTIHGPEDYPNVSHIAKVEEPWMSLNVITPKQYVGQVMGLVSERKGRYLNTEYLSTGSDQRALLSYEIPLASLVTDFYDKLKSITSGYASMNYELKDFEPTEVVKLDILVAEEPVEALATLVWKNDAYQAGKRIVESLKNTLPRQQFVLKIQAAIGGKVIAGDRLSAMRKDVTAGLYGGDVTRKRKVLEKQKKGKAKLKAHAKVDIPTEAYLAVLKR